VPGIELDGIPFLQDMSHDGSRDALVDSPVGTIGAPGLLVIIRQSQVVSNFMQERKTHVLLSARFVSGVNALEAKPAGAGTTCLVKDQGRMIWFETGDGVGR